jgi:hypothetical protein
MARSTFVSLAILATCLVILGGLGACNAILGNKDLTASSDAGHASDASFCTNLTARFPVDSSMPVTICVDFDTPGPDPDYGGLPQLTNGGGLTLTDATSVSPPCSLLASMIVGEHGSAATDVWSTVLTQGQIVLPGTVSFDLRVESECVQGPGVVLFALLVGSTSSVFFGTGGEDFVLFWESSGKDSAAMGSSPFYEAGAHLPTGKWFNVTLGFDEGDGPVPTMMFSTRPLGAQDASILYSGPLTTAVGFSTVASEVTFILGVSPPGDASPACTAHFDNFYVQSAVR